MKEGTPLLIVNKADQILCFLVIKEYGNTRRKCVFMEKWIEIPAALKENPAERDP